MIARMQSAIFLVFPSDRFLIISNYYKQILTLFWVPFTEIISSGWKLGGKQLQTQQPQAIACCRESFVELVPYKNRSVHFNHDWATKFRSKPVDRRGNTLKYASRERETGRAIERIA